MRPSRAGLLGLALVLATCGPPARPGTPPTHAVLITISGLRADRVGAFGYPRPTTAPIEAAADRIDASIDGLTASGVAFASAFAPSADEPTSLAELLTGARGPAAPPSLAEAFRAAGFRTAAFVTGAAAADPALVRGFAEVTRAEGTDPDYDAVRAAVGWLRNTGEPAGEPLFLWVHLSGPAAPWEPAPLGKDDYRARFVDPDYAGPLDGSRATLDRLRDGALVLDGLGATHLANLYDAEVARTARLVEQLASCLAGRFDVLPRDLLASSVVVLAGTRGVELFQHAQAAEDVGSLYDASLHVPLVVRHPASLTGRRFLAEPVELRDVAPTLRAWFGLEEAGEGRSLLALTDRSVAAPFASRPVVLRRPDGGSVRTPTRHLIVEGAERRLFDPVHDPLERRDLAAAEPETVRELSALLAPRE